MDCVVVYSLDRLSRNMADTVELVQHEWPGRCILRAETQPIGTDEASPTGELIFNVLASSAVFERGLIRERIYSGSVRRAREGRYPGSRLALYGYQPAAAVRRIFELAAMGAPGQGPTAIARLMEKEACSAPGVALPLVGETVRWILRSHRLLR